MEPISVFVSSTYRDGELRDAAVQSIRSLAGFVPLVVEESQATMRAPEKLVLDAIANADVVVVILGKHYGTSLPDRDQSFTEYEYEAAAKAGKPIIAMIYRGGVPSEKNANRLAKFSERVAKDQIAKAFTSAEDLQVELTRSLLALEDTLARRSASKRLPACWNRFCSRRIPRRNRQAQRLESDRRSDQ
jgi:hypothetical protein